MRPAFLSLLGLLFAMSAMAEEIYVPFIGEARLATELRIVNPTADKALITIEFLEAASVSPAKLRRLSLGAGESIGWRDAVAELFDEDGFGALRITCAACGITSTVPVLDRRDAIDSGTIPKVQRGAGIVNPGAEAVAVTVSLWSGDRLLEEQSLRIPARGLRLIRMDRLFKSFAPASDARLTFSAPQRALVFGYSSDAFLQATATAGRRRRSVRSGTPAPAPVPTTIVLTPSKDNTLFEAADGSVSNGAGVHLFAGMTAGFVRRRALVAFDVASQIPPGSQITRATLSLRISQSRAGPRAMTLHRVSKDWGQGSSNAGSLRDGIGAVAATSDATWIHTFRPTGLWSNAGGDFTATPDATAEVDFGDLTWESTPAMIARVQAWVDQPSTNFGWIVLGDESIALTAKRFDSREIVPTTTRPSLTIEYLAR